MLLIDPELIMNLNYSSNVGHFEFFNETGYLVMVRLLKENCRFNM